MTATGTMRMVDMRTSYVMLVHDLLRDGEEVTVRGQRTRELLDMHLRFTSPDRPMLPVGVGRRINTKLAAVEALSVIAGAASRELTLAAAPSYASVLVSQDERDFEYAAYGPRMSDQLDTVVHQLSQDQTSRQAVLSIWKRDDLYHHGDRPCTLTLQFLIRGDRLHLIVNMRSNDVWRGLGYDAFVFNQVHWTVLTQLQRMYPSLGIGEYHHHAASLHLYERDAAAARELAVTPDAFAVALPFGVVCPQGMYPDEVARTLLSPDPTRPMDMLAVHAANSWYAEQMYQIEQKLEGSRG